MDLPFRSGILTFSGRYLAAGSSRATSLRFTISANSSEVKTLVTDPISEDRVTIERAWIVVGEVAIVDDAAAGGFDETHDNADRLLLSIDAFYKDFADFVRIHFKK